jgi:hypothetical protein
MALIRNTQYRPTERSTRMPHLEQLALHAAILALALTVVVVSLAG